MRYCLKADNLININRQEILLMFYSEHRLKKESLKVGHSSGIIK